MNKQVRYITLICFLYTCMANFAHAVTPEKNADLGFQTFFFSLMYMCMAIGQVFGSNVLGFKSDLLGRKKIMLLACLVYSTSQFLFGISTNPIIIIPLRLISGFFSVGMFVSANAFLIDITTKEERVVAVTKFTAITSLGTSFGYFIGGIVGSSDYHLTFYFQSLTSLFIALLVIVLLKEPGNRAVKERVSFARSLKSIKDPLAYVIILMILTGQAAFAMYTNSSQQYLKLTLDFSPKFIGYYMAVGGVLGLVMNLGIFPILKRHFGIIKIALINFILIIISLISVIINLRELNLLMLISLAVFLLNVCLFNPLLTAILSNYAKHNNGLIMGLRQSFLGLGSVVGSFALGLTFDQNNFLAFSIIVLLFVFTFVILLIFSKKLTRAL